MCELWDKYISSIREARCFCELNLFLRSMKKMPHGGVMNVNFANCYMQHYPPTMASCAYFGRLGHEITNSWIFKKCVDCANEKARNLNISLDAMFSYALKTLGSEFWYCSFCVNTSIVIGSDIYYSNIAESIDKQRIDGDDWTYNTENTVILFLFALTCDTPIPSLKYIQDSEQLHESADKYGLSDVTTARFTRDGYLIDDLFYSYNIFIDKSIDGSFADTPFLVSAFLGIPNTRLYFRRDATVAIPKERMYSVSTADAQLFRGRLCNLKELDAIIGKYITVHYSPDTLDKLYMSISPIESSRPEIASIVVEQLWNPDEIDDDVITTNFIHATYNTLLGNIEHMDFSVNEYTASVYHNKYKDCVAQTGIPIDAYAHNHYKVWCIKSECMKLNHWARIVSLSLDQPFIELFNEIIKSMDR